MRWVPPLSTLVLVLLLVVSSTLSAWPAEAAEDETAPPAPQDELTLPAGGWAAYTLQYAGEYRKVGVTLTYAPSDDPNDAGLVNGNQVTMAVYGPAQPPPDGQPIGSADGNAGTKRFQLELAASGEYVFAINNWDSLGRPVTVRAEVASLAAEGSPSQQTLDQLTLISSSLPSSQATAVSEAQTQATSPQAKRVGVQAGHWLTAQLPDELARLRTSTGTSGGGVPEWQLNLDVAKRVAALLEAQGVVVDVLPSTIPVGYRADAFLALHADGDVTGRLSGFKLASGRWSGVPAADKALLGAISVEYQAATKLPTDWAHVSRNMTGYYAFSNQRFQHAVSAGTPAIILEMGFMTNRSDLGFLLGQTEIVADGIARGILRFLEKDAR